MRYALREASVVFFFGFVLGVVALVLITTWEGREAMAKTLAILLAVVGFFTLLAVILEAMAVIAQRLGYNPFM